MISQESIYRYIRSIPEDKLREEVIETIKRSQKKLIENDFDFFIDFLKENTIFTRCMYFLHDKTESREYLIKLLNCFKIQNIDIDNTLELIKDNTRFYSIRNSAWNISEIPLISDSWENTQLKCYSAELTVTNNWKNPGDSYTYKAICYKDKIIWLSKAYFYGEPECFIVKNDKIYGLSGCRTISIYKDLEILYGEINLSVNALDEMINQYPSNSYFCLDPGEQKNNREKQKKLKHHENKIDLTEYFYKGFFYKGFLFDRNWKGDFYESKIIGFVGEYLKMEIYNLTYPHTGYVLLDIENSKVVEAGKYE